MHDQELKDIQIITEILKKGGICIIPTEIGLEVVCDGTNDTPVSKLFSCFTTTNKSQFSLLISHIDQLSRYTRELPEVAEEAPKHCNIAINPYSSNRIWNIPKYSNR